jgi:hypothetical protein
MRISPGKRKRLLQSSGKPPPKQEGFPPDHARAIMAGIDGISSDLRRAADHIGASAKAAIWNTVGPAQRGAE